MKLMPENPNNFVDTITAQATPSGRGGVAIIRVSGPLVSSIIQTITGKTLAPRQASYALFKDHNGEVMDEGIAIYFPQPNSFTGEDVLELHGHGGPIIVDMLLQYIVSLGSRLARPGEFSERAFLNGKLDLVQAEAVADLIDASSQQAARSAMRSLQGEFSAEINALNEKIIHLRMYIEAAIDFAEEEIDFLSNQTVMQQLNAIQTQLSHIQSHAKQGNLLREGISMVITGEPNVGKSSLLNCLTGNDTAIVTDIPGTTRDVIRDMILIDGLPIHILDTAGLRESEDIIEQEGIRRAQQAIQQADLILYLVDASRPKQQLPKFDKPAIMVRNKIDLINEPPSIDEREGMVSISAKANQGLDLLKTHIKQSIGFYGDNQGLYLARRRHLAALAQVQVNIANCINQLTTYKAGEMAAEDLRLAHLALAEIVGVFTTDDLLGKIFASFCIGK